METLLRNDSWNPFKGGRALTLSNLRFCVSAFCELSYPGFDGMPLYILEVQS